MEYTSRKNYLDIAKGIGIIMVVWAHAQGPYSNYIIYFHMPLFFFISGMLFMPQKYTVKEYIVRKGKNLLIPFWGWNLIFFPIFFLLFYWGTWSMFIFAKELIEIVTTLNKVPFLGATWFLASLFWVSIIYKILYTLFERCKFREYILMLICLAIAIVGVSFNLPYRLSRTFVCVLFYELGYLFSKSGFVSIIEAKNSRKHIMAVVMFILYCGIVQINDCSLDENKYENFPLFILGGLLAIISTLFVARFVEEYLFNKIKYHLIYLGRNTLPIVLWQFIAFRFAILIQIIVENGQFEWLISFPVYSTSEGWWIIYTITGIYMSLMVEWILQHNFTTKYLKKIFLIR